MAPERYTNEAPDCRVDIFSCGVVLYELLTGTQPFRGSTSQVMYQVLHDAPPAPSTLAIEQAPPVRFDTVVARALARRPADRYASAAQLREALREAAGRPVSPRVSVDTMMRPRPGAADAPIELISRSVPSIPAAPSVPAPVTSPVSPSIAAWDPALLAAIEAVLVTHLGSVARLVLRDAARRSADAGALLARIAAESLEGEEREGFLKRARALLPAGQAAAAPADALPVLGTTPMGAGVVEKAQRVLAQHIGPIAGLIVRRAAAKATSREQFFTALADQAGEDTDRKQLLEQLWHIG
jgi:eukaryotic-like serine/threonine-protein kinase